MPHQWVALVCPGGRRLCDREACGCAVWVVGAARGPWLAVGGARFPTIANAVTPGVLVFSFASRVRVRSSGVSTLCGCPDLGSCLRARPGMPYDRGSGPRQGAQGRSAQGLKTRA
eukprot:3983133-Prymnesium_polylepis.2